ncbi:hypothetical protein CspeluHIS016_0402240 [Cutaneotrichosporon spelunceum]|uniref:Acetoacetate decarboxylase n=1 Tax=Cutaneotrichosporon spelunceum TaxID=1672016 RepID=A0AAD3TV22_9TREE|nr:hypothetical protein CspeluHIS016_0402240 [Cutaneotrichosporon spelunceum]
MLQNAALTGVPAPWRGRATVYAATFYISPSQTTAPGFKEAAYAPLERASAFADALPDGGIASVMVIRYHDTPVGTYDEMILIPGKFGFEVDEGGRRVRKSKLRITRIYVSQRNTAWNGRTNWNIPKHLARFEFMEHPDGSADFKMYPLDPLDIAEPSASASASASPLFQARFAPIPYLPSMPLSTRPLSWLVDLEIAQPPLPAGPTESTPAMLAAAKEQGGDDTSELAGTDKWCRWTPHQYAPRASLGWMDLRQAGGGSIVPGAARWALAVRMPESEVVLGEPEWWDGAHSKL